MSNAEKDSGADLMDALRNHLGDGEIYTVHHLRRNVVEMIDDLEQERAAAGVITQYELIVNWGEEYGHGHDGSTTWRVVDREFPGNQSYEQVYDHGTTTGFTGMDAGEAAVQRDVEASGWEFTSSFKYGLTLGDSQAYLRRLPRKDS